MIKKERYYQSIKRRDPAARNNWQIFWLYPSVIALRYYKVARFFWKIKLRFTAELITTIARRRTGIEIHPCATIGRNLFIDHGHGVVIGETSIIKDNVTLYHGVTLGAISRKNVARHPILEDDVVVGAGTMIMGRVVIGKNSRIGPNIVVRCDLPENSLIKTQKDLNEQKNGW